MINQIPTMPAISITSNGIKNLLCNLDPNKAMGPDKISPYILKYCAAEISPILQIIFTQSLKLIQGSFHQIGLKQISVPFLRKVTAAALQITGQYL